MTNKSKEYAQQVMLDGDKRLQVSVIIEGGGVAYSVEARLYDKDKQRVNNAGVQVSSPTQALEAMQELSRKVIETVERQPGVAEGVSRKIRRKMEECLFKEGVLARDDNGTVVTASVLKNRKGDSNIRMSNMGTICNLLTSQLRIPPFLGGLPFCDVQHYTEPMTNSEIWKILWANADDSINTEMKLERFEMNTPAEGMSNPTRLAEKLQKQLDDNLKLLRMRYPGDFEVVCLDATGQEHRFDEGSTYLAERHLERDFIWVYDRYGQKDEYSASRFSEVPNDAQKMEPYIPGNHYDPKTGIVLDSLGGATESLEALGGAMKGAAKAAQSVSDAFDNAVPQGLQRVLKMMNEELGR